MNRPLGTPMGEMEFLGWLGQAEPGEVLAAGAEWRPAAAVFDHALRFPKRVNPGTTADLIAAALYILLRDGRIAIDRSPTAAPGGRHG